jgi:hypothetical protein
LFATSVGDGASAWPNPTMPLRGTPDAFRRDTHWSTNSPQSGRRLEDAAAAAANNLQTAVTGIVASVAAAVLTHAEPGENATVLSVGGMGAGWMGLWRGEVD